MGTESGTNRGIYRHRVGQTGGFTDTEWDKPGDLQTQSGTNRRNCRQRVGQTDGLRDGERDEQADLQSVGQSGGHTDNLTF